MSEKQKKSLCLILISALTLALAVCAGQFGWFPEQARVWWTVAAYLLPYLLVGGEVVFQAIVNILHGQVFDESFLMALASIVAFALGDYAEAVIVMLFYQVGELFQSYAVSRSRASITELMNIRPEYANIEENGGLRRVDPAEVAVGGVIVVKPGERIPLDGTVTEGCSSVDTSALTGEPAPRSVSAG
ncbi:MAG: heavy metal translocating P-type ATPase, partial [Clostridiales bacterium]